MTDITDEMLAAALDNFWWERGDAINAMRAAGEGGHEDD